MIGRLFLLRLSVSFVAGLLLLSPPSPAAPSATLSAVGLRCEYRVDPLGVEESAPRLSWRLEPSDPLARGIVQAAYRILVASDADLLRSGRGDLWDSGKVVSPLSFHIPYAGKSLASSDRCYWKVKVWDGEGRETPWSDTGSWTMGLLSPADWKAKWIGRNPLLDRWLPWVWFPKGKPEKWAPAGEIFLRREFALPPERVSTAVFFVSSEDPFELYINGSVAAKGPGEETRGEFPVRSFLRPGLNALALKATHPRPSAARIAGKLFIRFENNSNPLLIPVDKEWKTSEAAPAGWEKAGFSDQDWPMAQEISAWTVWPWGTPSAPDDPLPLFRKEFIVEKPLRSAMAYVCGLGHYELRLNGEKVGDRVLDPGWTNYWRTCLYSTYDVTGMVRSGKNALGMMLGNGMFNVRGTRYAKFRKSFGQPRAIIQLRLDFADGTSRLVASDGSWKVIPGPIVFSCIYGGEDYNARRELSGWDRPGFDDSSWESATELEDTGGRLVAQSAPPVKAMEEFSPVRATEIKPGVTLYDLGKNIAGWPKIRVMGPAGAWIRIRPGELLDRRGRVNQGWSGKPSYFTYVCRGEGEEEWQPRFSYYGFRYLQVETEEPKKPALLDIKGVFVRSSAETSGTFSSSDDLLNKIMVSILTDCPHREKFGWLEQSHLMGPSVMYDFDVPLLMAKIVADMRDAQGKSGIIPANAPEYYRFDGSFRDEPCWGSAYIILPWLFYQRYGDHDLISRNYEGMKRYFAYLKRISRGDIISQGLGDWADVVTTIPYALPWLFYQRYGDYDLISRNYEGMKRYFAYPKRTSHRDIISQRLGEWANVGLTTPYAQNTPVALTSTAIFYYDALLIQKMAALLGQGDDARRFAGLAQEIREAFNREFFDPEKNRYGTGSQTANAIALAFGLVSPDRRAAVLASLVADIRARGGHTTAGDVGDRFVLSSLSEAGRADMVAAMAAQTDHPSYGYQLAHGATSLTEFWDGPTRGHSQNHMMMGHLEEWLYRYLAGIEIDYSRPPPERIVIRPAPVPGLDSARASTRVMEGEVSSSWERKGDEFSLRVSIPPNAVAVVVVPSRDASSIIESGRPAG
ncbi:MAG: family 78 glycoside hydrolase catalytic domain, partial [Candidatus Aureabacteria bacterium]|nr:family 78 glycoside hydrolase catalytic domain [Candidatus Auribacterota bacterium]